MSATFYALPVSTTHVSAGSLVGTGIVMRKAHWRKVGQIALAWLVTLPWSAALAALVALVPGTFRGWKKARGA